MIGLLKEYNELEEEISNEKSTMEIFDDDPFMSSSYSRSQYNEAKKKVDIYSSRLEKIGDDIKKRLLEFKNAMNSEKQFIGFKAFHNYRADNNEGNTLIGNYVAFFDKDLENVLFSLELETYNDYLHFIELMKERIEDE